MGKHLMLGALLWSLASLAGAVVLQDWSALDTTSDKKNAGVFTDTNGTQISISQVDGSSGDKALQVTASVVQWGGMWVGANANLANAGGIKFSAKASTPCRITVGLSDDKKVQYVATVRVLSNNWEEVVIPLSQFEPTRWPMPDAPKGAKLDLAKITGLTFQPQTQGPVNFTVGPVSSVEGSVRARIGRPDAPNGTLVVQDFTLLEKNAYGPFNDATSGTTIHLALEPDPAFPGKTMAAFTYELKSCGWAGYWIRAGEEWGGQDWRGARALTLKINSRQPVSVEIGFNDANQCAYTATTPPTKGTGWETLTLPMNSFQLNPYWQPPECKKGSPQDLSRIETFNVSPKTPGKQEFQLSEVAITK